MRFLVVTKSSSPAPPQMVVGMFDALDAWAKRYLEQGKIEQTWGFAGIQGGGGILNVNTLEELDAIMAEFPLAPFTTVEILGLVDLPGAVERSRNAARAMMPPAG